MCVCVTIFFVKSMDLFVVYDIIIIMLYVC